MIVNQLYLQQFRIKILILLDLLNKKKSSNISGKHPYIRCPMMTKKYLHDFILHPLSIIPTDHLYT